MRVRAAARRSGVLGHLLLVVVLAFSVFTMHTLGHPDERSGGNEDTPSSHSAASVTGHRSTDAHGSGRPYGHRVHDGSAHGPSARDSGPVAHHAGPATLMKTPEEPGIPEANGPLGHGMDPSMVCVAVLGSLLIAGLARVLLARRRPWRTGMPAAAAGIAPTPRAPPPRAPRLAELSVLRL
ncbi:hypothetical protein [Streptomyces sp. NPDC047108]|uniref:hypothetical protein n=1 Tax=Streptomyces sp. NPDC047108 TaxID=3155025 RepID=UPI003407913C